VFALVLPGKPPLVPHIGVALAAGLLGDTGLKGEERACGVFLGRRGVADEPTQVVKVFDVGRGFLEGGLAPFGDKVLGARLTDMASHEAPGSPPGGRV
jgi:hypothetical protein